MDFRSCCLLLALLAGSPVADGELPSEKTAPQQAIG